MNENKHVCDLKMFDHTPNLYREYYRGVYGKQKILASSLRDKKFGNLCLNSNINIYLFRI